VLSRLRTLRLQTEKDFSDHQTTSNCLGICDPSTALANVVSYGDFFANLSLVVFDDLHLLDPEYEMLILRVMECSQRANTRIIGCASSLYDGHDLAEWLRVPEECRFLFRPTDRSTALTTIVQPFSIPNSPTLMKSMVKPVYAAIKANLDDGAIVFVPSRALCRSVAMDLITRSGMEMDLNGFLPQSGLDIEPLVSRLQDKQLIEPLLHGIGMWWEGMRSSDSIFVLRLFAAGVLRALIVPRESCWKLKAQAGTVIVMGAQYVEVQPLINQQRVSDRKTRNYNLQELVKMQGFAAQPRLETAETRNKPDGATGRFYLMCQSEQQEIYLKFLNEGLPLESSLVGTLMRKTQFQSIAALQDMLDDIASWTRDVLHKSRQPTRQDFMDILSWSFLARRIHSNPVYYGTALGLEDERLSRLVDDFLASYFEMQKVVRRQIDDGTRHEMVESVEQV
jgi:antiviral helicase SLH1